LYNFTSPLSLPRFSFPVPRFQCSLKKKKNFKTKKKTAFIYRNKWKILFLNFKTNKKNAGLESMAAVRNRSINTTTTRRGRRKKNTKKNY